MFQNKIMGKNFKFIWLWIKAYKHALRVFGGIFFGLALISGLFWMAGKEIEPLAFVLGLLSKRGEKGSNLSLTFIIEVVDS
jgi:hypothetical protein